MVPKDLLQKMLSPSKSKRLTILLKNPLYAGFFVGRHRASLPFSKEHILARNNYSFIKRQKELAKKKKKEEKRQRKLDKKKKHNEEESDTLLDGE